MTQHMKRHICVSGMISSGKTHITRLLSKTLNIPLAEEAQLGLEYLERLFGAPGRWGFESQVAFLIGKAQSIVACSREHHQFVVDRSIEEDATIFFRHFAEKHGFEDITQDNYNRLYALLTQLTRPPDLQILCRLDRSDAWHRISAGNKFNHYTEGYVDSIFDRYREYFESRKNSGIAYVFDSSIYDLADEKVERALVGDVWTLCTSDIEPDVSGLLILEQHR